MSCPCDSWPSLKLSYEAKGNYEEIDGLSVYITGEVSDKAVIVIPCVWGLESGRTKAIGDHLAMEGYYAIIPDLFRGVPFEGGDLVAWGRNFPYEGHVQNDIRDHVIPFLKEKGVTSVGLIGFCWGCWVNFCVCGDDTVDQTILKAAVNCHPSLGIEEKLWNKNPDDLARRIVSTPQLLLSAGNDPDFVREGGSIQTILTERSIPNEVFDFDNQKHGWVNRGDISDASVLADVEIALGKAMSFFTEHL